MFLAIWQFLQPDRTPATQVPYSDFTALVSANKQTSPYVESVQIKDREYTFWVKDPNSNSKQKKITYGPPEPDEKFLRQNGVNQITFEKDDSSSFWPSAAVTILPMIFL